MLDFFYKSDIIDTIYSDDEEQYPNTVLQRETLLW